MIMETGHHNFQELVGKAFMVYGAFWVTALIVLYFAVGALMKKRERLLHKDRH